MSQEFVSLEIITELQHAAQGGCEWSRVQLEELGVLKPSPELTQFKIVEVSKTNFQVWEVCSTKETLISSHATKAIAELKVAAIQQQTSHANWCEENEF